MTHHLSISPMKDRSMASLECNASRIARLSLVAFAFIALASSVSSCASPKDGMVTGALADDYRQRHPIVLTQAEHNVDIPVAAGERGLTSGARDTVRGFTQDYKAHSTGTVEILAPQGSLNSRSVVELRRQIRRELVANGIPSRQIADSIYPADGAGDAAPIRLRFTATTAVTNACGQWPADLSDNAFDNQNYYNFGCAQQNNLAAQVANPTDLIAPRAQTPIDAEQRSKVIDNYRSGTAATGGSTAGGFGGSGF
jgi:pilus assembly protein CpaD